MKKLIEQIIKFGIVGVIATIIDWGIYYICYNYFGIDYRIANVIGFSISVIFNYLASVKYVFEVDKNKDPRKTFVLFITLSVVGLVINEVLLILLVQKLGLAKMLSKILASIVVMTFNFITRKMFLEENKRRK